jgi:hypothetical protein
LQSGGWRRPYIYRDMEGRDRNAPLPLYGNVGGSASIREEVPGTQFTEIARIRGAVSHPDALHDAPTAPGGQALDEELFPRSLLDAGIAKPEIAKRLRDRGETKKQGKGYVVKS